MKLKDKTNKAKNNRTKNVLMIRIKDITIMCCTCKCQIRWSLSYLKSCKNQKTMIVRSNCPIKEYLKYP